MVGTRGRKNWAPRGVVNFNPCIMLHTADATGTGSTAMGNNGACLDVDNGRGSIRRQYGRTASYPQLFLTHTLLTRAPSRCDRVGQPCTGPKLRRDGNNQRSNRRQCAINRHQEHRDRIQRWVQNVGIDGAEPQTTAEPADHHASLNHTPTFGTQQTRMQATPPRSASPRRRLGRPRRPMETTQKRPTLRAQRWGRTPRVAEMAPLRSGTTRRPVGTSALPWETWHWRQGTEPAPWETTLKPTGRTAPPSAPTVRAVVARPKGEEVKAKQRPSG